MRGDVLRWLLLALVVLLPVASAQQETLADLEEPHQGTEKVWDVVVTQDEAGAQRALIYRNPPGVAFGLVIFDAGGNEIFTKNGSRGVQTLPALDAGTYKFYVRRTGEFQVTEKAFDRILKETNVSTTLDGPVDAYVLSSSGTTDVGFTGNVTVEWWPLLGASETLTPPDHRIAMAGGAYVMTIRGAPGEPYTITREITEAPPPETPGPGLAALLAAVALLALMRRK